MKLFRYIRIVLFLFSILVGTYSIRSQQVSSNEPSSVFIGEVKTDVYTNTFFGFKISTPKDWVPIESEEKAAAQKIAAELLQAENEKNAVNYKSPVFKTVTLLQLLKKRLGATNNAIFRISATRQAASSMLPSMVAEASKSGVAGNPFVKDLGGVKTTTIAGRPFATFDFLVTSNRDRPSKNRYFVTMVRNYSVSFVITYHDEADGKYMSTLLETLAFGKNQNKEK